MTFETIISVDELAKNLNAPNLLILDCRSTSALLGFRDGYNKFAENHIPNARFCCVHDNTYSDLEEIHENILISAHSLVLDELMQNSFNKESQLIIYDEIDNSLTNQLWLFLRAIGFKNVAVLQGGIKAWKSRNLPLKKIIPCDNTIYSG
jgi:thiosulfate/3-mercaptopyruvate sulfurtransferase